MKTSREKFLSHLQKTIKTSTSATERTAARKLFADMTFGLSADGIGTDDISLPELPVTLEKRTPSEFDEQVALHDCSSLMHAVRALVAEAQAFVVWRRDMGQNDAPNSRWGDWQRTYSADLHIKHREQAERLNAEIAGNGLDVKIFWDDLFSRKDSGYPAEVRQQVRTELGV